MPGEDSSSTGGGALFSTTHWSLVLAAGDSHDPRSREALAELCVAYWYPVYVLVRHLGNDAVAAQDLTQGFFVELLEKKTLAVASPDRGRFRAFLKTAVRNYLSHERERAQAQKRGGGRAPIALDLEAAETRYRSEPGRNQNPESLFEKRWARTLMTRALEALRKEFENSPNEERYRQLEPYLTGSAAPGRSYDELARELDMSAAAIRTAVRRLRKRYGEFLRLEVGRTVSSADEIDQELRHLFSVVQS